MSIYRNTAQRDLTHAGNVTAQMMSDTEPGMAYFAHTGPSDKRCKDCTFFVEMMRKGSQFHCAKHAQFSSKRKRVAITGDAPACKYFLIDAKREAAKRRPKMRQAQLW